MGTECILVIGNNSPLIYAMDTLLIPETGINAIKSTANDLQNLLEEICEFNARVVILEDVEITSDESQSLAQMLMSKRELKFIVVLRNSNHIYVFRKDEVLIQNSSDFIEAIRSA